MARSLDVYLNQQLAGKLTQDKHGEIAFAYREQWLKDNKAIPLSHSLPLRVKPFTRKKRSTQPTFYTCISADKTSALFK